MTKVSEVDASNSKYLKVADLQGREARVTIREIKIEPMKERNGSTKNMIMLYFKGKEKPFGLNKTNSGRIARAYGDDTEDWVGCEIVLFPDETEMDGKTVPCIRVKMPPKGSKPAQRDEDEDQPKGDGRRPASEDDEIPF